jgi:hypothetical protein
MIRNLNKIFNNNEHIPASQNPFFYNNDILNHNFDIYENYDNIYNMNDYNNNIFDNHIIDNENNNNNHNKYDNNDNLCEQYYNILDNNNLSSFISDKECSKFPYPFQNWLEFVVMKSASKRAKIEEDAQYFAYSI